MNRIALVRKKDSPNDGDLIVWLQGDGHPAICIEGSDDYIKEEDLLFPQKDLSGLSQYECAALQGLLSNPNIVKNLSDVKVDNGLYNIVTSAKIIAARMYYDEPDMEWKPLS